MSSCEHRSSLPVRRQTNRLKSGHMDLRGCGFTAHHKYRSPYVRAYRLTGVRSGQNRALETSRSNTTAYRRLHIYRDTVLRTCSSPEVQNHGSVEIRTYEEPVIQTHGLPGDQTYRLTGIRPWTTRKSFGAALHRRPEDRSRRGNAGS